MTPDSLSPLKSFMDDNSAKASSFNSLFNEKNQSKIIPLHNVKG